MSELKFACPVCGQHITADSRASGEHLECPTCFRKLVVPQPPACPDSKLILTAAEAAGPRRTGFDTHLRSASSRRRSWQTVLAVLGVFAVLVGLGATAAWHYGGKVLDRVGLVPDPEADDSAEFALHALPESLHHVPKDIPWTMDPAKMTFPNRVAVGSVHGRGFACERATLQGGHLSLRDAADGAPALGVSVEFFVRQPSDLSGKTIEIAPSRLPPVPRVAWRWRDAKHRRVKEDLRAGYALKLAFGQVANGRLPGKIYLCLPDDKRSFVAGTFDAEIKPAAPNQAQR